MIREEIKATIIKMLGLFPLPIQKIFFKIIIETRYLFFVVKLKLFCRMYDFDPLKIYYISPRRIIKCLSPVDRKGIFNSEKRRGKVLDGDWDQKNCYFSQMIDVFRAFKKRIEKDVSWDKTDYYSRILTEIKLGNNIYGLKNVEELQRRCKNLDLLYLDIKKNGYFLNRYNYIKNITFDEVDVTIGRNGDYIFRDGIHRLSIAKILRLECIPVTIFVRHKQWNEFKNFLRNTSKRLGPELFQPFVHPDLLDISHNTKHEKIWESIKSNLNPKNKGFMVDLKSNVGFYCHKFEDLGYQCCAIESSPLLRKIMNKLKKIEQKNFQILDKIAIEDLLLKKNQVDVVLVLDGCIEYFNSKNKLLPFINFLNRSKTKELFIEGYDSINKISCDKSNSNADCNFITIILQHTALSKQKQIYKTTSGTSIYKLSK